MSSTSLRFRLLTIPYSKLRLVRIVYSGLLSVHTQPKDTAPTTRRRPNETKQGILKELIQTDERSRAFLKSLCRRSTSTSEITAKQSCTLCTVKTGSPQITRFNLQRKTTTTATSLPRLVVIAAGHVLIVRWRFVSGK